MLWQLRALTLQNRECRCPPSSPWPLPPFQVESTNKGLAWTLDTPSPFWSTKEKEHLVICSVYSVNKSTCNCHQKKKRFLSADGSKFNANKKHFVRTRFWGYFSNIGAHWLEILSTEKDSGMVWREGESAIAATDSQQWLIVKTAERDSLSFLVITGGVRMKWNCKFMEFFLLRWLFFTQRRHLFTISYKWTISSLFQIVIIKFHNLLLLLLQCLPAWKGWRFLTLNKASYQLLPWIGSMITGLPLKRDWECEWCPHNTI